MKPIRLALTTLLFAARIALTQITSSGNPATTPAPRAAAWWIARHQAKLAAAQRGNVDLLFAGDSITENYESLYPALWNQYFAPHRALNLGFSGDETGHLLWRLQNGEVQGLNPANIVLLIGTNNTGRGQTAPQVTAGIVACVEELHRLMPSARILVLNILPTGSEQKSAVDRVINANVDAHYAASSYARTLDLSSLFLKDGVADASLFYDPAQQPPRPALHPNPEGQRRMAEAVSKALYPTR